VFDLDQSGSAMSSGNLFSGEGKDIRRNDGSDHHAEGDIRILEEYEYPRAPYQLSSLDADQ
jgi:hypothetical protein